MILDRLLSRQRGNLRDCGVLEQAVDAVAQSWVLDGRAVVDGHLPLSHSAWAASELQFVTSPNVSGHGNLTVSACLGNFSIEERLELKAPGVQLDNPGALAPALRCNLMKDQSIPVGERLRSWCRGSVSSAVYAVGGCSVCRTNLHRVRCWVMQPIRGFLR